MVTSNLNKATLAKYKNYCQRKNITFFDGNEIDDFIYDLEKKKTIPDRKQFIYDKLGIEVGKELKKPAVSWLLYVSIGLIILGVLLLAVWSYVGLGLIVVGLMFFYRHWTQKR